MIGDSSHKHLIRQISIISIFLETHTHTHHFKIKGTGVENNLLKIKTFLLKQKKNPNLLSSACFFLPITLPAGLWEMFAKMFAFPLCPLQTFVFTTIMKGTNVHIFQRFSIFKKNTQAHLK